MSVNSNLDPQSEFYRKRALVKSHSPVISTTAYTASDVVGDKISLQDVVQHQGLGGFIHSITVIDKSAQKSRLDIVLFNDNPAASTFTDNLAMNIAAADVPKIIGTIPVDTTGYIDVQASLAVATVRGVGLEFDLDAGNNLYAAIRSGGTPTYTSADALEIKFGVVQG